MNAFPLHRPRSLPLRRWLVVALVLLVVIPVGVIGLSVHFLLSNPGPPGSQVTVDDELRDDVDRWHDPAWQEATRLRLAEDGISFVLLEDGQEFYRSGPDPLGGPNPPSDDLTIELVMVPGVNGEPDRTAFIYLPDDWNGGQRFWVVPPILLGTLLLTLGGIGWFLGRTVVGPLRETAAAAHGIADGQLDVVLPPSRVREVAEVNQAFTGMSAALRDSLQRQAEIEEQRRAFIAAIAHDLRTPLFSLRGSLEGLDQGIADTPEKQARYIAIAREKAAALDRLIGDLFEFSRLEYLDQMPRPEPLDLAVLLRALSEGFLPRAESKGVRLDLDLPADPAMVDGDPHLLTRAIENLLDNALRHTPGGGVIRITCHDGDTTITFSVADTGPGIPPDDLPRIFSPLFRADTSRSRSTGGAGLGLVITQRILRAHGGDISASNRLTGGAIFSVHLPAALAEGTSARPTER